MGKVRALLLRSSHISSKEESDHSRSKSFDTKISLKKGKREKTTSKNVNVKDCPRLKAKKKRNKCATLSNSLKLPTNVLRSEKHVSCNWENLSKALGINTVPTYQLDSIKTQVAPQDNSSSRSMCATSNNTSHSKLMNRELGATLHHIHHKPTSIYSKPTLQPISDSLPSKPGAILQHRATHSSSFSRNTSRSTKGQNIDYPEQQCMEQQSLTKVDKRNRHFRFENTSFPKGNIHRPELLTKVIAMDCEMVGVGTDGKDSNLARISIVNANGECVYDKYVRPVEEVTDYRTDVSGIRPEDLKDAGALYTIQKEIVEILKDRIVVGHSLKNDFSVLFLSHPRHRIRDTSKFRTFRAISGGRTPSLKKLACHFLQMKIQSGEHNSIEDAQAAMQLYQMFKKDWERLQRKKKSRNFQVNQ